MVTIIDATVFHNPGRLVDDDLELILAETYPANEVIGYVPAYHFNMVPTGQTDSIGHIEFRVGNIPHIVLYAGHIGYWVAPEKRGHHYAARACRLLLPLALQHGLETLWITCNPDNLASRKTCDLIGAELVEIVDLPPDTDMYREGARQKCRYRLVLA